VREQRVKPDFIAKTQPQDYRSEGTNSWEKKPFDPNAKWDRHQYGIWVSARKWEGILIYRLRDWFSDLRRRHEGFEARVEQTIRNVQFCDDMIQKKAREIEVISLGTESDEMPEITYTALQEDGVSSGDWLSFKDQSEYESYREFIQGRIFAIQGEIAEVVETRTDLVEKQREDTRRYMEYYEGKVKEISDNDLWEKLGTALSVRTWNNELQDMIGFMQRNDLIQRLEQLD
tara:strand:+ start:181 stop:873 length:693 start_codon:yes stop_codon:yes gene_type:complete